MIHDPGFQERGFGSRNVLASFEKLEHFELESEFIQAFRVGHRRVPGDVKRGAWRSQKFTGKALGAP